MLVLESARKGPLGTRWAESLIVVRGVWLGMHLMAYQGLIKRSKPRKCLQPYLLELPPTVEAPKDKALP